MTKTTSTKRGTCSKPKLSKTKVLQLVQKNFATAGIVANVATQTYPLNTRIWLGFLTLGMGIIFNFKYTFYEARTFIEYTQSIFMSSLTIIVSFALLNLVVKVRKLFEFINHCDDAGVFGQLSNGQLHCISFFNFFCCCSCVAAMKFPTTKPIYLRTVQLELKLSKIVFFLIKVLTPVFFYWPWSIYVYFIYFTGDAGNAAFELPFPMW